MPQPLLNWSNDIQFNPEAVTKRPELATLIAKVSATWAMLEVDIGLLLAVALDTEARTGVAMYLGLTGSAAQEHVLSAAMATRLSEELASEFSDILNLIRKRARERNKVVHCLWAASPRFPDALINCPPENLVRDVVEATAIARALNVSPLPRLPPSDQFISALRVYKDTDFLDIIRRINDAMETVHQFAFKVAAHHVRLQSLARGLRRPVEDAAPAPPDTPQTNRHEHP